MPDRERENEERVVSGSHRADPAEEQPIQIQRKTALDLMPWSFWNTCWNSYREVREKAREKNKKSGK